MAEGTERVEFTRLRELFCAAIGGGMGHEIANEIRLLELGMGKAKRAAKKSLDNAIEAERAKEYVKAARRERARSARLLRRFDDAQAALGPKSTPKPEKLEFEAEYRCRPPGAENEANIPDTEGGIDFGGPKPSLDLYKQALADAEKPPAVSPKEPESGPKCSDSRGETESGPLTDGSADIYPPVHAVAVEDLSLEEAQTNLRIAIAQRDFAEGEKNRLSMDNERLKRKAFNADNLLRATKVARDDAEAALRKTRGELTLARQTKTTLFQANESLKREIRELEQKNTLQERELDALRDQALTDANKITEIQARNDDQARQIRAQRHELCRKQDEIEELRRKPRAEFRGGTWQISADGYPNEIVVEGPSGRSYYQAAAIEAKVSTAEPTKVMPTTQLAPAWLHHAVVEEMDNLIPTDSCDRGFDKQNVLCPMCGSLAVLAEAQGLIYGKIEVLRCCGPGVCVHSYPHSRILARPSTSRIWHPARRHPSRPQGTSDDAK